MSTSRQQRRARMREMAKSSDIKTAMARIEANSQKVADAAYERWAKKEAPKYRAQIAGEMFLLAVAYMHIVEGWGAKRLQRFAYQFDEFCDDMTIEKTKHEDLFDMLKADTGVDFERVFAEMDSVSREHIAKRLKEIS